MPQSHRNLHLDVETFQQLLEAAFVLQEHNDRLRAAERAEARAVAEIDSAAYSAEESAPGLASRQSNVVEITTGAPLEASPRHSASYAESSATAPDTTSDALAEIVATQHQIQTAHLEFQEAIELICERAQRIVHADGALIGLLAESRLVYSAGTGNGIRLVGHAVPANACLTTECLTNGATLHSPDVESDYLLDAALCAKLGIRSLIAVPIYFEGSVVGSLQLHFAEVNAFQEPDIRSCQLLAGLITEAKARSEEQHWKKTLAAERESMLQALEALKPQLEKLATEPAAEPPHTEPQERPTLTPQPSAVLAKVEPVPCAFCGNLIEASQTWCGVCGSEKPGGLLSAPEPERPASIPSTTGTKAQGGAPALTGGAEPVFSAKEEIARELPKESLAELEKSIASAYPGLAESSQSPAPDSLAAPTATAEPGLPQATPGAQQTPGDPAVWQSASKAKAWLETVRGNEAAVAKFWNTKRADLYLGIALLLVAAAIAWMLRPSPAVTSNGPLRGSASTLKKKQASAPPKLSIGEQLLVDLGLADPPSTPVDSGNPEVKVWVDLQTALYYCPGADLYGKTVKGKFTTQRDAQMDQFEPAGRRACN